MCKAQLPLSKSVYLCGLWRLYKADTIPLVQLSATASFKLFCIQGLYKWVIQGAASNDVLDIQTNGINTMALFRNIMIVGALALVIPADTEKLGQTAETLMAGTATVIEVASAAASHAAAFCDLNASVCATIEEMPRTVRIETIRRTPAETQVISRSDVNTTILVRAAG